MYYDIFYLELCVTRCRYGSWFGDFFKSRAYGKKLNIIRRAYFTTRAYIVFFLQAEVICMLISK